MSISTYDQKIKTLLDKIEEADAILIGAASGMSAAAGHTFYYERSDDFVNTFGDFEKKFGFHNAFDGYYYPFPDRRYFWAYVATFVKHIYDSESGKPYKDLKKLLEGKDYHILTTNQDTLFEQDFPAEKISAVQGDWRYFQCKNRCHDKLYYNKEQIDKMYDSIEECKIPEELIPRCPVCGGEMEPWVRGLEFLQGQKYQEEYDKINAFLEKHTGEKILFLELGVGRMTPEFIQRPFWNLTFNHPNGYYITVNPNHALVPLQIQRKATAIEENIEKVLEDAEALANTNKQRDINDK